MEDKYTGDLWGDAPQPASTVTSQAETQAQSSMAETSEDKSEQSHAKPTPQESFQEMRAKNDRLQKERDEALLTLRRIEEYALQQQQQQALQQEQYKKPEPVPEPDLDDDDYVEAKHFKSKISNLEKQLSQFQQQQQSSSIEMQLRAKYPDFDRVMTYENIAKLREARPEIAQALHQSSDLYNKAASTYTILKEMGIHQDSSYEPERERAQHNFNKPQTASSLKKTESALSHASEFNGNRLTEDRKKEIWLQMQRNLRG